MYQQQQLQEAADRKSPTSVSLANSNRSQPGPSAAQLRRVLDTIFPPSSLSDESRLGGPCSLLSLSQRVTTSGGHTTQTHLEASSEPASRASVRRLRLAFKQSLRQHRAKPAGLCGLRRIIFDQCFEELIRQVTVGCVEQGLLLVCVRNEFRATLAAYELAYQSAIEFGLRKAVQAQLVGGPALEHQQPGPAQVAGAAGAGTREPAHPEPLPAHQLASKSPEQVKTFYEAELAKKDKIIEQQRAIIRAITQEIADKLGDPGAPL